MLTDSHYGGVGLRYIERAVSAASPLYKYHYQVYRCKNESIQFPSSVFRRRACTSKRESGPQTRRAAFTLATSAPQNHHVMEEDKGWTLLHSVISWMKPVLEQDR